MTRSLSTGLVLALLGLLSRSPASAASRPVAASDAPRQYVVIHGDNVRHVYPTGEKPQFTVLPINEMGQSLADSVDTVEIASPQKPFAQENWEKARELLLDGQNYYQHTHGLYADFYGIKDESAQYLEVTVKLKEPARLFLITAIGAPMNDQYSFIRCEATVIDPTGQVVTLGATPIRAQEFGFFRPEGICAQSLKIRAYTRYKLNLTEIRLLGVANDAQNNFAADWPQPQGLRAAWVDSHGRPRGAEFTLPFYVPADLTAPDAQPGYYGLKFFPVDQPVKEYGFVILPSTQPGGGAASPFGLVHMDLTDPYTGAGWCKTLTSGNAYNEGRNELNVKEWTGNLAKRRALGLEELPIATAGWKSDPEKPVSAEDLDQLRRRLRQYFAAAPDLQYWELGIEENLGFRKHKDDGKWPCYWDNLEKKAAAVREVAKEVNPQIKLIFQIAELDLWSVKTFLASPAAKHFDILSLHPYAWATFPTPEKWMPDFLAQVRAELQANGLNMPIWFTEIGAPHAGNPGGFFGYPGNHLVRGQDRAEAASYMLKCHCLALQLNVEKILWYNYRDRGQDPTYPEDHFGLVDHWGYPKPVYAAYATMTRLLTGRKFLNLATPGDALVYRFGGEAGEAWVVWIKSGAPAQAVDLKALVPELASADKTALDMTGAPLPLNKDRLNLDNYPMFIIVKKP